MIVHVVILSSFMKWALVIGGKSNTPFVYIDATLDFTVSYCHGVHSCVSYLLHNVRSHLLDCFQDLDRKTSNNNKK